MENKENAEKVVKIVRDYKNESNKNLTFAMDFIMSDFENTKENNIKLTKHLDKLENTYNTLLSEYKKRTETK
jgi:cytochrome c556